MSYSHHFYAVDLDRLQDIYGSGDTKPITKIIKQQPKLKPFLDSIVKGEIDASADPAGYGYALKELCESIGPQIGDDVADVRDYPYESRLASSGPPIPIPYDRLNFPQIGFIELSEIGAEIDDLDGAPPPHLPQKFKTFRGDKKKQVLAEISAEMQWYRDALEESQNMRRSIVSFRH